jgi:hypothetical protein
MPQLQVSEDFESALADYWHRLLPGGATLEVADSRLRLALPGARQGRYSNAQIDDYGRPLTSHFHWRPPLRMEVRARASHPVHPPAITDGAGEADGGTQHYLRGTMGFGFWNTLLTLGGGVPRLPEAVWFFAASPPSNMALVPGIAGWGWKAQVVHAHRWGAVALSVPTAASVGWARLSGRELAAGRWVQRFTGACEAHLTVDASEWHEYTLEWRRERARFFVDGHEVLQTTNPPRGPLGFVAWIDNQYAIVTPRGALRFGTVASAAEWLELDWLRITSDANDTSDTSDGTGTW